MIRITDQYFWNFVFGAFFVFLVAMGTIILSTESRLTFSELTITDFMLITLATWRLIRLFVYDHGTKWWREQFFDIKKVGKGFTLEKPKYGPRRTIADLLTCPWCFGLWAAAWVLFFFMLTPYAYYAIVLLAISAVATWLQLISNMVGWQAEKLKKEVEN